MKLLTDLLRALTHSKCTELTYYPHINLAHCEHCGAIKPYDNLNN